MKLAGCLFLLLWANYARSQMSPTLVDTNSCGRSKGCFRVPPDCSATTCTHLVTWYTDEHIHFEFVFLLSEDLKPNAWAGVGFSNDTKMAGTSVVTCVVLDDGRVLVEASYNTYQPRHKNVPLTNSQLGIVANTSEGSVTDGRVTCRFTHLVEVDPSLPDANLVAALGSDDKYHLLAGTGPADDQGTLHKHYVDPVPSYRKVSMADHDDVNVSPPPATAVLVKAHGSLMLVAWTLTAGLGMIIACHFKPFLSEKAACNRDTWFMIHICVMMTTLALTLAGVICIIVYVGGWTQGSVTHPAIGLTVIILAGINPIIAQFRPSRIHPMRWLFNLIHGSVGYSAQILAFVAMFLGIQLSNVRIVSAGKWLIVAMAACRLVTELVLALVTRDANKEEMTGYTDMSSQKVSSTWHYVIFGVYQCVGLGITIALLVLLNA